MKSVSALTGVSFVRTKALHNATYAWQYANLREKMLVDLLSHLFIFMTCIKQSKSDQTMVAHVWLLY